ncbi:sigma-70 family RNA polymerase sigma factor [Micromonospora sp. NPDC049662]|uniref:sigma-70 family RNA polymerase sigma factor n=1 Tax=Micromonospora sp. NPDC049662 TaxID=3155397 RepID=UPI003437DB12
MPTLRVRPSPRARAQGSSATNNDDVRELVSCAQAGDPEAFGQIYDRYVDQVFKYIHRRVRNRHVAEDLTSETFLRAMRSIQAFRWMGRDFGAWLTRIARNLVVDHFKSGRHRLEIPVPLFEDEKVAPGIGPEQAAVDYLGNLELLRAVTQLTAEQQTCIVLRFLRGLSLAETAQAMRKKEAAVKTLQFRAVRALARQLPAREMAA